MTDQDPTPDPETDPLGDEDELEWEQPARGPLESRRYGPLMLGLLTAISRIAVLLTVEARGFFASTTRQLLTLSMLEVIPCGIVVVVGAIMVKRPSALGLGLFRFGVIASLLDAGVWMLIAVAAFGLPHVAIPIVGWGLVRLAVYGHAAKASFSDEVSQWMRGEDEVSPPAGF